MKTKLTTLFLTLCSIAYSQQFIKHDRKDFYSSTKNIHTVFVDKNDNVYAGTFDQLFRYNGTSWDSLNIPYKLPGAVYAITQDINDSIRFGVLNNGIYATKDMSDIYPLSPKIVNKWVNVLVTDPDGKIWVGTNAGVSVINGKEIINYTLSNGLKGSSVKDIKIGPEGSVYIGTEAGLSIFKDGNWKYLTVDSGMVSNNVNAIEIDGNGHLWIGTDDKGISKYDGKNWITYNDANTNGVLFTNQVKDLLWDGNTLWVAGFNLSKFKNNTWTKYSGNSTVPTFPNHLAKDSKGNIWISDLTAITMYNKQSETSVSLEENHRNTVKVFPNPATDLIFLPASFHRGDVSIYNTAGILIRSGHFTENQIDLKGLEDGMYFFKISNEKGEIFISKVIKK